MLLATWNVNSLRARMPRVVEFCLAHQPSVLAMQETKMAADATPLLELEAAGYSIVDHSSGRWAGVAIAARPQVTDVVRGLPGEPLAEEARWLEVEVNGLRIVTVYVINGRTLDDPAYAAKLRFLDAMHARLSELTTAGPLVVAGDFNIAPADLDVYDPASFVGGTHVSAAERDRLRGMLDLGLVDAYRHLHPTEVGYTWWDYRGGHFHKRMGLRIDMILVSKALARGIVRCDIDRTFRKGPRPSDHAPLLLQLERHPV